MFLLPPPASQQQKKTRCLLYFLRGGVALAAVLHVGGPEGEVVAEQLHDEGRVLVIVSQAHKPGGSS